jgi:serine/threonine-protein kinase
MRCVQRRHRSEQPCRAIPTEAVLKLSAGSSTQNVLPFTGLNQPEGVAVDSAGDLYVVDYGNTWVVKLAAR